MIGDERNFGSSSFVGELSRDPAQDPELTDFWTRSAEDRARLLGWAAGCPVVLEVIQARGAEAAMQRYAELNFWSGQIIREVGQVNPALAERLREPMGRRWGEEVRAGEDYDWRHVSRRYEACMEPTNTLFGYAAPRLFIEHLDRGAATTTKAERAERLALGLDVLERAAQESATPSEFLVHLAEGLVQQGAVEPQRALQMVFGRHWLREQRAYTMFAETKDAFRRYDTDESRRDVPTLWKFYSGLTPKQKDELQLA